MKYESAFKHFKEVVSREIYRNYHVSFFTHDDNRMCIKIEEGWNLLDNRREWEVTITDVRYDARVGTFNHTFRTLKEAKDHDWIAELDRVVIDAKERIETDLQQFVRAR